MITSDKGASTEDKMTKCSLRWSGYILNKSRNAPIHRCHAMMIKCDNEDDTDLKSHGGRPFR